MSVPKQQSAVSCTRRLWVTERPIGPRSNVWSNAQNAVLGKAAGAFPQPLGDRTSPGLGASGLPTARPDTHPCARREGVTGEGRVSG
jgi:hypothetical protein